MSSYGMETFDKIGSGITISADGRVWQKSGGITIDWSLVPAVDPGYVFLNEDYTDDGGKFLRYGTVMARVTATDKFAPYGAAGTVAAGAGSKGHYFVLNQSVHQNEQGSDHLGEALYGGKVYARRLIVTGLGDGTNFGDVAEGTGATFTATVATPGAGGTISGVTVTAGGSGYANGTHPLIFTGGTPETPATATATVVDGVVVSTTITNAGLGFDTTPTVAFGTADRLAGDIAALNLPGLITLANFEIACPDFVYVLDNNPA